MDGPDPVIEKEIYFKTMTINYELISVGKDERNRWNWW